MTHNICIWLSEFLADTNTKKEYLHGPHLLKKKKPKELYHKKFQTRRPDSKTPLIQLIQWCLCSPPNWPRKKLAKIAFNLWKMVLDSKVASKFIGILLWNMLNASMRLGQPPSNFRKNVPKISKFYFSPG